MPIVQKNQQEKVTVSVYNQTLRLIVLCHFYFVQMWKVTKAFKVSIKWENGVLPKIQVNRKTYFCIHFSSFSLCNTTTLPFHYFFWHERYRLLCVCVECIFFSLSSLDKRQTRKKKQNSLMARYVNLSEHKIRANLKRHNHVSARISLCYKKMFICLIISLLTTE